MRSVYKIGRLQSVYVRIKRIREYDLSNKKIGKTAAFLGFSVGKVNFRYISLEKHGIQLCLVTQIKLCFDSPGN